jgi:hypothetical protein
MGLPLISAAMAESSGGHCSTSIVVGRATDPSCLFEEFTIVLLNRFAMLIGHYTGGESRCQQSMKLRVIALWCGNFQHNKSIACDLSERSVTGINKQLPVIEVDTAEIN